MSLVVRRSIKCVIEPCRFRGRAAVKKRLERREPPWTFYMRREIAVYRAFATLDLPIRVPRMLGSDVARGVIVLERVEGQPLAPRRHAVPQDRSTWQSVIAIARAIPSITCAVDVKPTKEERRVMRSRLLEDPTAPTEWISSGLRLCAAKGLIAPHVADVLARDVKKATFQHGDLLLRNVMREADHLVVVDWECAGPHAEGWDHALLSVFAPEWARAELARGLDARSLRACFVFALLREIVFRRGRKDEILSRLEEDLERALRGSTP